MNKIKNSAVVVLSLIFFITVVSCMVPSETEYEKFNAFCPYMALTTEEIKALKADGFSGTDEEIASSIHDWQLNNMILQSPIEQADVSYAMRWNYSMPGLYPVKEMVVERTKDVGGVQKIYGVCWDFAAIFSAIARSYGLTTRITAYRVYMSDRPENEKWNQQPGPDIGLGPEEYSAFNIRQKKKGLEFPYEIVTKEIKETWEHYRAEVKIGDVWKAFDATEPTGEWADDANYTSEATWDEGKSGVLCN